MKRQAINPPNDWGSMFEMNQAERITDITETITFSGQTSIVSDADAEMGVSVKFPDDQRAQMQFILETIDNLLNIAGLTRKHITHIRFFTVDMEGFLGNYDVYVAWIKEANIQPPQSAIGVNQLVVPGLMIEIEVTAAK